MATGKIKTLFSDREKTEPLFPRTKTSAISADDGTGLDAILEEVIYSGSGDSTVDSIPINADTLGGLPAENYATQTFVSNKIAKAQLSGGEGQEIDLSGYATKDEMNALSGLVGDSPVSQQISTALDAIDYPVDSVNGKTGAVSLSASDVGAAIGANYLVNGRDLDTVIDSGMYRLDESHTNMPADCFYGQLLVIRGGADTIAQLAFDYTFGKMWVRSAKDIGVSGIGTWSDWNCCYTTGNKPTLADIGAAPAGYGLGATEGFVVSSGGDCNYARENGWYYVCGGANAAHEYDHVMLVASYGTNAVQQIAFMGSAFSANTNIAVRKCSNGSWREWEWLNPPMAPGVEYRTTERWYNGSPIYTQIVNLGTTTEDCSFNINISGLIALVRAVPNLYNMYCTDWDIDAGVHTNNQFYFCPAKSSTGVVIYVRCGSNNIGKTLIAQVWYTK